MLNCPDLSPDQREKAARCHTPEELLKFAKEEGIELSDEDLEKIAEAALAAESWSASPADIHDAAGVVSLMRAANALGMSALG